MSDDKISQALGLPTLASFNENKTEEKDTKIDVELPEIDLEYDEDIVEGENEIVEYVEGEILDPEQDQENYIESTEKLKIDNEYIKEIDLAQKNMDTLISDSHIAFNELLLVATQTGNATAFDAASKLLKTLVDANEKKVSMAEKKRSVKNLDQNVINNTTNNTLILTTAELLKQLKKDWLWHLLLMTY